MSEQTLVDSLRAAGLFDPKKTVWAFVQPRFQVVISNIQVHSVANSGDLELRFTRITGQNFSVEESVTIHAQAMIKRQVGGKLSVAVSSITLAGCTRIDW